MCIFYIYIYIYIFCRLLELFMLILLSLLCLRLPVGSACIRQWSFPPGVKAGLLQKAMRRHGSSSPLLQRLCAYSLPSSLIYIRPPVVHSFCTSGPHSFDSSHTHTLNTLHHTHTQANHTQCTTQTPYTRTAMTWGDLYHTRNPFMSSSFFPFVLYVPYK